MRISDWSSDVCSSDLPEQYAEVERPARCRVKWLDRDGAAHEQEFDGLMATCMQHEIDHLNGVLFIDHLSRLKRHLVVKKLTHMRKNAASAPDSYSTSPQRPTPPPSPTSKHTHN